MRCILSTVHQPTKLFHNWKWTFPLYLPSSTSICTHPPNRTHGSVLIQTHNRIDESHLRCSVDENVVAPPYVVVMTIDRMFAISSILVCTNICHNIAEKNVLLLRKKAIRKVTKSIGPCPSYKVTLNDCLWLFKYYKRHISWYLGRWYVCKVKRQYARVAQLAEGGYVYI